MPSPHTPGSRDRAMARLRRLTVGSILGSLVAFGSFATAAALSYSGQANATSPSTPATSAPSTSAPTSSPTTPTQQTPRSTPTPVPTQVPFFGHQPRATTGGS